MADSFNNINNIKNNLIDENYARDLLIRIRRELSDVEHFFLNSSAHWEERFYDTEIVGNKDKIYGYEDLFDNDLGYNFNKIYRPNIGVKIDSSLKKYYPLRTFYFDDNKAICNVYGILWDDITTNKGKRDLYIRNNGLFALNKYGKTVSYKLRYDVQNDSYSFDIKKHKDRCDFIDFSNNKDYIVKKLNKVTFLYNKQTDNKIVHYVDYNQDNNYSSTYSIFYDKDNNLNKIQLLMDMHKVNGRPNGSYFIEIDKNNIKPLFITRKGIRSDLRGSKSKSLDLSMFIYKDYEDTLNKEEDQTFKNLKLYALGKVIDSFENKTLSNEKINESVKDAINKIDNSITPFLGEIPFSSLDSKMRNDLIYTRRKTMGKHKNLVK